MKVQCIQMASIKEMQLEIFTLHILTFLYNGMYVCWCGLAPALAHIEPVCGQRGKVGRGGGKVAHWDTLPHLPGHKLPGASCN